MTAPLKSNWFGPQSFAQLPESVLLDSRLRPRHFKLLCALYLHAGKDGMVWPGLERLAEMLGHYNKDGSPNKNLVSKLISWSHADKAPGLGLVQLGYIKKLGWIANRETQSYQMLIANIPEQQTNTPTCRKMSDATFAEKRQAKVERLAEAAAVKQAKADAKKAQELFFDFEGDRFTRNEVHNAHLAGELDMFPRTVVEHFGYAYE